MSEYRRSNDYMQACNKKRSYKLRYVFTAVATWRREQDFPWCPDVVKALCLCMHSNTLPLFTHLQVLDEGYYNVTFTPCNGRPNSFVFLQVVETHQRNISTVNLQHSQLNFFLKLFSDLSIIVIIYWFNIYEHTLFHSISIAHTICATDMNDTTNCVTCWGKA